LRAQVNPSVGARDHGVFSHCDIRHCSWLVYNQVALGDPLAFLRGEYATHRNIGRIVAESGLVHYPPLGDPLTAMAYYVEASV
jgi:hypothetical protein